MKKSKVILIVVVVALLALVVYANYRINSKSTAAAGTPSPNASPVNTENSSTEDYFDTFRADRNDVRNKEIEYLDEIIAASGSDDESLVEAQRQKLALVENMEKEFTIETLLKAKGFADAAVTFHAGSVNIVIGAAELTDDEVAVILDIAARETGEAPENIKIMSAGISG